MAGNNDFELVVGVKTTQAEKQLFDFVKKDRVINLRVNSNPLGTISDCLKIPRTFGVFFCPKFTRQRVFVYLRSICEGSFRHQGVKTMNIKKIVADNKGFLVFMLGMALVRSALADYYSVPSSSMYPTLLEGDRVICDRIAYDLKVPSFVPTCLVRIHVLHRLIQLAV